MHFTGVPDKNVISSLTSCYKCEKQLFNSAGKVWSGFQRTDFGYMCSACYDGACKMKADNTLDELIRSNTERVNRLLKEEAPIPKVESHRKHKKQKIKYEDDDYCDKVRMRTRQRFDLQEDDLRKDLGKREESFGRWLDEMLTPQKKEIKRANASMGWNQQLTKGHLELWANGRSEAGALLDIDSASEKQDSKKARAFSRFLNKACEMGRRGQFVG